MPLSIRLWRVLRNPPAASPLYQQIFHRNDPNFAPTDNSFVSALFFFLFVSSGGIAAPFVLFWLVGIYAGAVWMRRILKETRPYTAAPSEILNATPLALGGLLITITLGTLHRRHRLENILSAPLLILRVLIAILLVVIAMILLPTERQPTSTTHFFIVSGLSIMLFIVVVNTIQRFAILSAVCVALVFATYRWLLAYLQAVALIVYVALHMFVFLMLILITHQLWSLDYALGSYIIPAVLAVLLILMPIVYEAFISAMWFMLRYRLGNDTADSLWWSQSQIAEPI